MANGISDDQQDDLELDEELEDGDDTGNGDDGDTSDDSDGDGEPDKRVRELQSARDKETARANKAEKELKELQARNKSTTGDDPARAAELEEIRQDRLDGLLGSDEFSLLKTYGIDRALVTGNTRAEMRESATQLVGVIKSIETKAKNAALKEHGITPAPAGTRPEPRKNYATMTDDDFEKELNRARAGGRDPIW